MKAGIFFTGSGPIVILTSYGSFEEPEFLAKLAAKGIQKFIAHEVDVNQVKESYGKHYDLVLNDLQQSDDLRVLDYNGQRIFNRFTMDQFYNPIYYEA